MRLFLHSFYACGMSLSFLLLVPAREMQNTTTATCAFRRAYTYCARDSIVISALSLSILLLLLMVVKQYGS